MSKKTRFKLEDLRVESFLTKLEDDKKEKIKGGCYITHPRSGCVITYGCTVSDNPFACCAETIGCTVSDNPIACCID